MKKLTFMFLVVFFTATVAHAQFEIKAFVGSNFAGMSGHDFGDVKANAGYQFGGGVLIGDKFYVEPSFMFGKKSSTITAEGTTDIDFDQNFVRIPIYAGYHVLGHESGPLALRLFAGPTVTIPGSVKSGDDNIFHDDNMKGALWGVDGGLGVDIFFLFVEFNYEHSFSNHFVDGTAGKHNSIYINAGVHFDF